MKQATLLHNGGSLLGVLLGTWGTGKKASSAWFHETPKQQLPSATATADDSDGMADMAADQLSLPHSSRAPLPNDVSESPRQSVAGSRSITLEPQGTAPEMDVRGSADLHPDDGADRKNKGTSKQTAFTSQSCEKIVGEARVRLGLDGQQAVPGALAAASLVQISAVMATAAVERRSRLDDEGESFRALIFSGVGSRVTPRETGLEYEELLQFVSLLLELSSSPIRSEVTYANPDGWVVEAARSVASRCGNEFGIVSGGRVRLNFIRSSLDDFLSHTASTNQQQFDFVNLGGPLYWGGGGRNNNGGDTVALQAGPVLHADTLSLLGPKLAPGACLKAWAFARNPFTSSVFRAAVRHKRRLAATASTTGWAAEEQDSGGRAGLKMMGRVLRTRFGIGQSAFIPRPFLKTSTESTTLTAGTDEEEMWVRQVLVGGDRLSIPDIGEVLAGGGFELVLMLGKKAVEQEVEEELLGEGLSRWEMADFADSLEPVPTLVHQVLAVWRGGRSDVDLPQ